MLSKQPGGSSGGGSVDQRGIRPAGDDWRRHSCCSITLRLANRRAKIQEWIWVSAVPCVELTDESPLYVQAAVDLS
uniref:Uncharacterized protein n=1 Tax=Setaria viridis TaxID=4556 RepID=A0A4U6TRL9_SETVI|nr:hypothetical protein SEVIR_7G017500v2 [Setaria viridis]